MQVWVLVSRHWEVRSSKPRTREVSQQPPPSVQSQRSPWAARRSETSGECPGGTNSYQDMRGQWRDNGPSRHQIPCWVFSWGRAQFDDVIFSVLRDMIRLVLLSWPVFGLPGEISAPLFVLSVFIVISSFQCYDKKLAWGRVSIVFTNTLPALWCSHYHVGTFCQQTWLLFNLKQL